MVWSEAIEEQVDVDLLLLFVDDIVGSQLDVRQEHPAQRFHFDRSRRAVGERHAPRRRVRYRSLGERYVLRRRRSWVLRLHELRVAHLRTADQYDDRRAERVPDRDSIQGTDPDETEWVVAAARGVRRQRRVSGHLGPADRSGLGPQASWKSEDCEQTDDHGPEFHAVSPPLGV